jgi:hypothetical protein
MQSLRDVQRAIQLSLLRDEDGHAADHIVGGGLAPAQRLGIYRNTMLGTLANALRLTFPAVHRLVGADFFDGAAQIFARDRAPRCADLNAYGAEFPDFLQRFAPAATLAYLADVARLEWAVSRALHAPDADPLTVAQLATVAAADGDKVCFFAHPSVSTLRSEFAVDAIWRAVLQHDDMALAAIDPGSGPVSLLVQRVTREVEVERLEEGAWRFATALFSGRPLGAAIESAVGVDAPALLAQHLSAGRLVAFRLASQADKPCRSGDMP